MFLKDLSHLGVDDLVGNFVMLGHNGEGILASQFLIRESVVLGIRTLNKVTQVFDRFQFGLEILSPAHKELQRNVSASSINSDLHHESINISGIQVVAKFSKHTMSSKKVELELSILTVSTPGSKVLVIGISFLNNGIVFVFLAAAHVWEFVENDWHYILSPSGSNFVICSFSNLKLDKHKDKNEEVAYFKSVVFIVPYWLMLEEGQ